MAKIVHIPINDECKAYKHTHRRFSFKMPESLFRSFCSQILVKLLRCSSEFPQTICMLHGNVQQWHTQLLKAIRSLVAVPPSFFGNIPVVCFFSSSLLLNFCASFILSANNFFVISSSTVDIVAIVDAYRYKRHCCIFLNIQYNMRIFIRISFTKYPCNSNSSSNSNANCLD